MMFCANATAAVPAPSAEPPVAGARVPNESLHVPGLTVENRNHAVVASPSGFAVPLSVASAPVTAVGAPVVTAGGSAGVVNDATAPNPVPKLFCAIAQ